VNRRTITLLATVLTAAALSAPAAATASSTPAWAPEVPWGAGCEPAPTPATRTAANCGATLVDGEAVPPPDAPPVVKRVIAAANEIEGIDDEDLGPVALGDLMDLRVSAALDQEGVLLASDPLETVEEVADEFDLVVVDFLEAHVLDDGPLMAGSGRSKGHQRDLPRLVLALPHPDDQG